LSKIAERLFNVCRKAGTDAWYIERDIDGDLQLVEGRRTIRSKEHVRNCVKVMRSTSARLSHVAKATA
jgi:hypothetical protein